MFDGGRCFCAYCQEELYPETATIDHATALTLGGRDRPSNYLLACYPCNQALGREITMARKLIKHNCNQCHQLHSKQPCPLTKKKEEDHARTTQ
jgi:hypothetical protein